MTVRLHCVICDNITVTNDGYVFSCPSCGTKSPVAKEQISNFFRSKVAFVNPDGIAVPA